MKVYGEIWDRRLKANYWDVFRALGFYIIITLMYVCWLTYMLNFFTQLVVMETSVDILYLFSNDKIIWRFWSELQLFISQKHSDTHITYQICTQHGWRLTGRYVRLFVLNFIKIFLTKNIMFNVQLCILGWNIHNHNRRPVTGLGSASASIPRPI